MTRLARHIQSYITGRFERLERQAVEIREATIRMAVAAVTQCREPLYSRVLERALAGYSDVPPDRLIQVIRRIADEEVARASAE
jgi:hypothetical protein